MTHHDHTPADYSKHTDEELREAIAKIDEQESRVAAEDSLEALGAARAQREAMREELAKRVDRPSGSDAVR